VNDSGFGADLLFVLTDASVPSSKGTGGYRSLLESTGRIRHGEYETYIGG
jgi:hypothetical protein